MSIRLQIVLRDAMPRSGCNIGYKAFPEEGATMEEVSTANVVMALCSLLSDPDFIEMVAPRVEKELKTMRLEQEAAIQGSERTM